MPLLCAWALIVCQDPAALAQMTAHLAAGDASDLRALFDAVYRFAMLAVFLATALRWHLRADAYRSPFHREIQAEVRRALSEPATSQFAIYIVSAPSPAPAAAAPRPHDGQR